MRDLREYIKSISVTEKYLEYYIPLTNKVDANLNCHPDVSIETCKALLEGVSKTAIKYLNPKFILETKNYDAQDIDFYVKNCFLLLRENDDSFEQNFITRVVSLSNALGHLRNARGDISHGRSAPKELCSPPPLAIAISKITEGLLLYILEAYLRKKNIQESQEIDEQERNEAEILDYDDNISFNDYLDELYPLDGKALYSKALYDQYYDEYKFQFEEYSEQNIEE